MTAHNANQADMVKPTQNKWRSALEFGPLLLFFGVNYFFGIYAGTATLVIATIWHFSCHGIWNGVSRKWRLWLYSGGVFGGLTILMEDEFYIKIKPTVASLTIAGAIIIGYDWAYNPIRTMMEQLNMPPDSGVWRELTYSFVGIMVILAVANEIAWRNLTTEAMGYV